MSDVLVVRGVELRILRGAAYQDAQVGDLIEVKRGVRSGCRDSDKVCAVDTFEEEAGAWIGLDRLDLDVAHLQIADVAKIESLRGHWAEHTGIGVLLFELRRSYRERVLRCAAEMLLIDIGKLDVLNRVIGHAAKDGA